MTPIACVRVMKPTSTKLTTMTVVALLLCRMDVTKVPTNMPLIGVPVSDPISFLRRSPAIICRESPIMMMP